MLKLYSGNLNLSNKLQNSPIDGRPVNNSKSFMIENDSLPHNNTSHSFYRPNNQDRPTEQSETQTLLVQKH